MKKAIILLMFVFVSCDKHTDTINNYKESVIEIERGPFIVSSNEMIGAFINYGDSTISNIKIDIYLYKGSTNTGFATAIIDKTIPEWRIEGYRALIIYGDTNFDSVKYATSFIVR